jgi:hypothetical protein
MIEIKAMLSPYDTSHATGLSLTLTVKDERATHARIIDKPLEDITLSDAAQLIKEIAQEMLARA